MSAAPCPLISTDPHDQPSRKALHQYFVTHILIDCAQLPEEVGTGEQQASEVASSVWQCCSVQAAYKAALLQHGQAPAQLQHLISTFAAAVLRVSHGLGSAAGQLLQQRAFSAAEQVHSQLVSLQRDQQLLAVARDALALHSAAGSAASLTALGTAQQPGLGLLLQDNLQHPLQQRLQEDAGLSWKQTLQQLSELGYQEDDTHLEPALC